MKEPVSGDDLEVFHDASTGRLPSTSLGPGKPDMTYGANISAFQPRGGIEYDLAS